MSYRELDNSIYVKMRFRLFYLKRIYYEVEKTSIGNCCFGLLLYCRAFDKFVSKFSC